MPFTKLRRLPSILSVLLACQTAQVLAGPSAVVAIAAAEKEVRLLAQLMVVPWAASASDLSRSLHFHYRQTGCRGTNKAKNLCSYEIEAQQSEVGRILTLEIGDARDEGGRTGRIVWVPWLDDLCLTTEQIGNVLGRGHEYLTSAVFIVPGDIPTDFDVRRGIDYTKVPGAAPGSRATASFNGQCLLELTINF